MSSVWEQILAVAENSPRTIAISCGGTEYTYGEFAAQACAFRGKLRALGVAAGSVVPIMLDRSFDQIAAALGVMAAGAAYLPIDPTWPDGRILTILKDSQADLIAAPLDRTSRLDAGIRCIDPVQDGTGIGAANPVSNRVLPPDSLAYIIYTSGSTGVPKGVEITHSNLTNLIEWHRQAFDVTREARASHIAGLGFDAAVWEVWPYLAAGATLQLPGPMDDLIRTSPAHLLRWLHDGHITHAFVPTALAEPLIQSEWPETTLLRYLLTGGDALRMPPTSGLPFVVVNNYGPTECTVVATSGVVTPDGPFPPPIGRPIRGSYAYVLDQNRQPVLRGETGELYIGGANVGRGYRNLPEQTAAAYLADPFQADPDARMYRTGDFVSELPDGQLAFHGRRDSQEKIRGQRMELDEINSVLAKVPGVLFSSVGTRCSDSGEKHLVAFVLPDDSTPLSAAAIQQSLAQSLSSAMVPAVFVRLRAMPLNTSGKLDLSLLPEPSPENALGDPHAPPAREATELEAAVLETVHGLLGSSTVGLDDDFFLSGGHSLLGAQLVTRIRARYGVALTLRDLFEAPTAALLAEKVEHLILAQIEEMSDAEAEAAL